VIYVFEKSKNPVGLKVAYVYYNQLFKIMISFTRASTLDNENFHSGVKILGWPTKKYGTFSGRKLHAFSKNVHGLYFVCLEVYSDNRQQVKKGKKLTKIFKFF
jgi:hypothetical protein